MIKFSRSNKNVLFCQLGAVNLLPPKRPRRRSDRETGEVPSTGIGPFNTTSRLPTVETQRLLGRLVRRALHTREGDEKGARDSPAAQGHYGHNESQTSVVRQRLGRRSQVHMFLLLPPRGKAQGYRRVRDSKNRNAVSFAPD